MLQSELEPQSDCQEGRATLVSVVTHRLNPNTGAINVAVKPKMETPAPASEPAHDDVVFEPAAYFGEWLQALEDFRGRPARQSGPSVYLADSDADLAERVSLENQPPDEIRSEGTLVVTEYGTLEADVAVNVAVIDGIFKGKMSASERVLLKNHGLVIGEINTPALTIHGGAIIEGRVYFQPAEEYFEPLVSLDAPIEPWEQPGFNAPKVSFARVWLGRIFQ